MVQSICTHSFGVTGCKQITSRVPSGSYWLFSMPDALRDGVSRGVMAAKRGHVEGSGGFSIKSSGWESGQMKSQLLFWMLYGMTCSFGFSALNNYTFTLAILEVKKKKKVRQYNHNLVCYPCDEAALWKSIAVDLWKILQLFFCNADF